MPPTLSNEIHFVRLYLPLFAVAGGTKDSATAGFFTET